MICHFEDCWERRLEVAYVGVHLSAGGKAEGVDMCKRHAVQSWSAYKEILRKELQTKKHRRRP